jgi:hypothetical protein
MSYNLLLNHDSSRDIKYGGIEIYNLLIKMMMIIINEVSKGGYTSQISIEKIKRCRWISF